ncbi:DUF4129 domain-containing protein [Fibrella forsythiae]|uniref:DUF4129 domain-containing protein n=1 Tax=Fibrella forsythiae TaxID=2817061 RepID=A0ABS3JFZ8_9BACT|nr:DUF4129 domain-containing protein [Fibrella forsythiae]MBO0948905.1 DUF4129 domain-containing protein [Fibrella forsythiae]
MLLKRLFLCFLLTACLVAPVWAQDSTGVAPGSGNDVVKSPEDDAHEATADSVAASRDTVVYAAINDRTPITVRAVDAEKLRDIQGDRAYRYGTDVPPTASLWDQFWAWFWYKVGELLRTKAYRNVGQYVLIVAVAALVVWLLYKAEVLANLFPKRAKNTGLGYETLDENIHQINFSDRINEAVDARNYRLAVRLLYLQTLKGLTDSGLIRWQPDKTNRQYAYELTGNPKRLGFEQLTTQFEYAWYGDFPVDEVRFGLIYQQFKQFNELEKS